MRLWSQIRGDIGAVSDIGMGFIQKRSISNMDLYNQPVEYLGS